MASRDIGRRRPGKRLRFPGGAAPLVAAVTLLAAGCGSSGSSGSSSSSSSSAGSGTKKLSVGVVLFSAADTSSMSMVNPFVAAAKQAGDSVDQVDSGGAPDKAIAAIQTLVTKRVDAIFVPVWEPQQIAAGAQAAKAAGIPIIGMGGGVGTGVQATWDNAARAGGLAASRIVKDSGGKGDLLVISYSPGRPCRVREAQLKTAIKGTAIQVDRQELQVPDIIGSTENITSAWLKKHPQGSGRLMAWLCADSEVPGSLTALQSAGRSDVQIYSMGGEPPALAALGKGKMAVDVYVKMRAAGQQLASELPKLVKGGVGASPRTYPVDANVLDTSNIKPFLAAHPQATKK